MSLFNKDKKPTLKKKSAKNSKTSANAMLSKYLPTSLFIGIKDDVNKKTLESYITSLSQSLFANSKEGKYSIKKLSKDKYIYEIHNGSNDLTYLPLVISKLIDGNEKEIILKTSGQNVRVVKKTATKIETNTLIESNNRDDDAIIDYDTKGKMVDLVKPGTEFFLAASLFAGFTGLVASFSFLTKYYMLNADYSYNPEIPSHLTAIEFLNSINKEEHTQTSFLKHVKFEKGKWEYEFETIEAPNKILTEEELSSGIVNLPESDKQYDVVNAHSNFDNMVKNNQSNNDIENNMEESNISHSNIVQSNISEFDDIQNTLNISNDELLNNKNVVNEVSVIESVVSKDSNMNDENLNIDNEVNSTIQETKQVNEIDEIDEFEILSVEDVNGLDISNLPDNVVVE